MTIFSDFQCPYCSQLARMLNKEILPTQGKTTRIVFRYFPLTMHPWARPAAEAVACAQEQGDEYFWRPHDFLFEQQHQFNPNNVVAKITEETKGFQKFDSGRFAACLASKRTAPEIDRDIAFGTENGVDGTPTVSSTASELPEYERQSSSAHSSERQHYSSQKLNRRRRQGETMREERATTKAWPS